MPFNYTSKLKEAVKERGQAQLEQMGRWEGILWLTTVCSVKRTSSVDRGMKTEVSWYAMPGGDCVQPRPSFTVASSKVTLPRCDWTMFTS